jgi:hypothetical protein
MPHISVTQTPPFRATDHILAKRPTQSASRIYFRILVGESQASRGVSASGSIFLCTSRLHRDAYSGGTESLLDPPTVALLQPAAVKCRYDYRLNCVYRQQVMRERRLSGRVSVSGFYSVCRSQWLIFGHTK